MFSATLDKYWFKNTCYDFELVLSKMYIRRNFAHVSQLKINIVGRLITWNTGNELQNMLCRAGSFYVQRVLFLD
jgi:hypothetical protein